MTLVRVAWLLAEGPRLRKLWRAGEATNRFLSWADRPVLIQAWLPGKRGVLNIKERFDAEGIDFAFPSRTVYLKQEGDGQMTKPE